MSVSQKSTHCPEVKLYSYYTGAFGKFRLKSKLETGLQVLLAVSNQGYLDYNGGTLKFFDCMATSFWVEIQSIKKGMLVGRVIEDNYLFSIGSIFHFKAADICQVKGSRQWNIENLTVLVSEKILYGREKAGYFYDLKMEPWSFGRIYYSLSELAEAKAGIHLIEIPLSNMVSYDPAVEDYLDFPATNGFIRIDDLTFKEFDKTPRNEKIFPLDFCGPNENWDDSDAF